MQQYDNLLRRSHFIFIFFKKCPQELCLNKKSPDFSGLFKTSTLRLLRQLLQARPIAWCPAWTYSDAPYGNL